MDQVRKAMDLLVGANFVRQDLSALVSIQDGPIRPILQSQSIRAGQSVPRVTNVACKGKIHYWDEQGLIAPTGVSKGYQEGGKPNAAFQAPVQVINGVGRQGAVAAVTDTMAAIWTGAGSYTLADGELERLYREALDFDVELKCTEVLNEMEYIWINGNMTSNTAYSAQNSPSAFGGATTSQWNGLIEVLSDASNTSLGVNANYGNAVIIDASQPPYNGILSEQLLRDAGRKQALQKTPYRPDLLLVTDGQLEIINSYHPSIITMATDGLTGGSSVDRYNTGFSKPEVVWEPQLPAGTMILACTQLLHNAPLIRLGAEPLARVQTQVERMITVEMSIEVRVQKAHVLIQNLSV